MTFWKGWVKLFEVVVVNRTVLMLTRLGHGLLCDAFKVSSFNSLLRAIPIFVCLRRKQGAGNSAIRFLKGRPGFVRRFVLFGASAVCQFSWFGFDQTAGAN